jgi:hypothetical protein
VLGRSGQIFPSGQNSNHVWGEIIPPAAAFIGLAILPYLEELIRACAAAGAILDGSVGCFA